MCRSKKYEGICKLLTRLTAQDTASLGALNRRLWAWVEGEYHHASHRGLGGVTPYKGRFMARVRKSVARQETSVK
jgi:hypothetical protein